MDTLIENYLHTSPVTQRALPAEDSPLQEISQREAAILLGISDKRLSQILNDEQLDISTIKGLLDLARKWLDAPLGNSHCESK